jgi:hypothetical protein
LRWTLYPILRTAIEWNSFGDYQLENYIDAESNFLPPVLSESSVSSLKTINACESFHAHFNALFWIAHLDIFVLSSALQKIQNETYIKMRRLNVPVTVKKVTSPPQRLDSIGLT